MKWLKFTHSFFQKISHLFPEIVAIKSIVDSCLQETKLVTSIIAISLHLESVYFFAILYHPSKRISKADLSILGCTCPIFLQIIEHLRSDDIFSDDTEPRARFCRFWLLEEFCHRMENS